MMDPERLFKSVLEADGEAIVLCAVDHTVVYMNPAARERYAKWGGGALVGKSLLECHNERSRGLIEQIVDWFKASADHDLVHTFYNEKENKDVYMAALRDDGGELIGYYEKQVHRDRETMKLYDLW